jgi:hypothetical protein
MFVGCINNFILAEVCNEKTKLNFLFLTPYVVSFIRAYANVISEMAKEACHLFPAHSSR